MDKVAKLIFVMGVFVLGVGIGGMIATEKIRQRFIVAKILNDVFGQKGG